METELNKSFVAVNFNFTQGHWQSCSSIGPGN